MNTKNVTVFNCDFYLTFLIRKSYTLNHSSLLLLLRVLFVVFCNIFICILQNITIELYCNMIVINEVLFKDITAIYIGITTDNDMIYNMSEVTFLVIISVTVFEDHYKLYKVIMYPAGVSQAYEITTV